MAVPRTLPHESLSYFNSWTGPPPTHWRFPVPLSMLSNESDKPKEQAKEGAAVASNEPQTRPLIAPAQSCVPLRESAASGDQFVVVLPAFSPTCCLRRTTRPKPPRQPQHPVPRRPRRRWSIVEKLLWDALGAASGASRYVPLLPAQNDAPEPCVSTRG